MRHAPLTPAECDDASRLLALREAAARWMEESDIQQWRPGEVPLEDFTEQIRRGEWLVVRDSQGVISAVRLQWADELIWNDAGCDHVAYVHGLVIDGRLAGTGLGRHLLTGAEAQARAGGARLLRLDCVEHNSRLRSYYRQQGFREVGRRDVGEGWTPVALFEKPLDASGSTMPNVMSYRTLLANALPASPSDRPVAIAVDGHGGAGKSTFAQRLAAHHDGATVIHVDDFARPGWQGFDVQRLLEQVLEPLSRGHRLRYQRFDWSSQELAEWHEVKPGGVVIVEGVSALRREFGQRWDLTIWIETPRATCLERGLLRDGADSEPLWQEWIAAEDAYTARDDPRSRADMVVDGAPNVGHDPTREFVVLTDRTSRATSARRSVGR